MKDKTIQKRRFYKSPVPVTVFVPPKKATFQFPRISLSIPESFTRPFVFTNLFLVSFSSGFLLVAISIIGIQIKTNYLALQEVEKVRSLKQNEFVEWEKVVTKYPGYKDGYRKLASIATELGNTNLAGVYLEKSKEE